MPGPAGYVRTLRGDRLLAYLGIARYASADQLHRLYFDGASKKQTYRRLAKLCEPGGQPGEGPCLRRLAYRRRDGLDVPVWALAPFGRSIASKQVPWLRPPASADIGARFLEHTLVLNEVLASLVVALRASSTTHLYDLPFRWLSEDDDSLGFRRLHKTGVWLQAVLKPDAIMTIPARRRRLFIEAEMGSQSIATANPEKTGAVLSKLDRYRVYFTVRSDDDFGTWYRSAFPDDFAPRVAFLVHSDERRRKVERAVRERLGIIPPQEFKAIVLTFAEAPSLLAHCVREGSGDPVVPHRERVVRVDETLLGQVRDGYNAMVEALKACRKVIADHNQRGGPQLQLPGMQWLKLSSAQCSQQEAKGPEHLLHRDDEPRQGRDRAGCIRLSLTFQLTASTSNYPYLSDAGSVGPRTRATGDAPQQGAALHFCNSHIGLATACGDTGLEPTLHRS